MSAATAEGHRERKKRKTRERIIEAAIALFDADGFEATTVAEIAAAAEIAPRTFFAYFPSKEHVIFHDSDVALERMRERFAGRPAGESAIDALRGWIEERVAEVDRDDQQERRRRELISREESLIDHDRALRGRFQEVLAEALGADFGAGGEVRAEMVAAASVAALATLTESPDGSKLYLGDDPMAVVDEALIFVRGGMESLERSSRAEGA